MCPALTSVSVFPLINALELTDDLLTRSCFDTYSTPIQHFTGTHTRQHLLLSAIDTHLRGRESVHIHMKIHMHKHTHAHTRTHNAAAAAADDDDDDDDDDNGK